MMAHRTVSSEAILVVARMIPAHLAVAERQAWYPLKKQGVTDMTDIRTQTIAKWQKEWNKAKNGRWTRRLIQDIGKWIGRRQGCSSFHLTQMLTGHGCFEAYLFRFKRRKSPACLDCGAEEDDAEHTIFRCDR